MVKKAKFKITVIEGDKITEKEVEARVEKIKQGE